MDGVPETMVLPSMTRKGIMRGGILQIMVTRACDQSCHHCTQGSNLGGRNAVMTPDEFAQAIRSLGFPANDPYFGVVGVFGGNPAVSKHFEAYCEILRENVPFEQRGIWCNNPLGKGVIMRDTFNPRHSNLNVHMDQAAYDEFARDWPESVPFLKGHDKDSEHGAVFVAMKDVIPDETERLALIGDCDVNKHWSALIGVVPGYGLRAFFCEIAYSIAAMHASVGNPDWDGSGAPLPDIGLPADPGWWRKPLADFADQVRTCCHNCGIPLRRPPTLALGVEPDQFSETHRAIARMKRKSHSTEFVESIGVAARASRPSTEYLPGTTPKGGR